MKNLFVYILLFFVPISSMSQIKMCEVGSSMYSKCFVLSDSSNTFRYSFNHCTGSEIGIGTYKKLGNRLIFRFDTITKPIVKKVLYNTNLDTITIVIKDLGTNRLSWFKKILYKDFNQDNDTTGIFKIPYFGGDISIVGILDSLPSLTISPHSDICNVYEIQWFEANDTFVNKGKRVKMTRVLGRYKLKEKVLGYSDNKGYYSTKRTTYYK